MNGITGLIKETSSAVGCYGVKRQTSMNQDPGSGPSPGNKSANAYRSLTSLNTDL